MFQGQTVAKPNNLVVDVTSSHQPGMVYVMLSRVCSMQQLHIIDKFDPEKILMNDAVRVEAVRMARVSLNSNPCLHNPEHGRLARQRNPCKKFPQATYIDAIHWTYLLGGATATVFQFPLKGAAAITSHKIEVSISSYSKA